MQTNTHSTHRNEDGRVEYGVLKVPSQALKSCWEFPIRQPGGFLSLKLLAGCYKKGRFARMRHARAISLEKARCKMDIPILERYSQPSGKELVECLRECTAAFQLS